MTSHTIAGSGSLLEREAPIGHSLPMLDGYRAIASLMVVTTHAGFSTAFILTGGAIGAAVARFDLGVAIFFLLSGFLLYRAWARTGLTDADTPSTGRFYRRRLWRILPAYWVMAICVFLLLPTLEPTVAQVIANLGLVQIYGEGLQVIGLTQTWSLAVELVFYLVLPAIGALALLRGRTDALRSFQWQSQILIALFTIGAVFTIMRTVGPLQNDASIGFWLTSYLDWFAVGMGAALVQVRLSLPDPPRALLAVRTLARDTTTCLIIAVALFVIAATPLAGQYTFVQRDGFGDMVRHFIYPAIALFFLLPGMLGADQDTWWRRFLLSPGMQFLGTISYGIFLWHLFVLDLIYYFLGLDQFSGGIIWILPLTITGACALGWLSWVLIERPAIRYSHGPSILSRLRARRQPA